MVTPADPVVIDAAVVKVLRGGCGGRGRVVPAAAAPSLPERAQAEELLVARPGPVRYRHPGASAVAGASRPTSRLGESN